MSKLITASLVGAVEWAQECPPSWKERAKKSLDDQLNRVWVPPEPGSSLELGIDFENKVYHYADAKLIVPAGSEHFQWFVSECRGGVFQKKTRRIIELDGEEYCLYGKIDAWFPEVIKDIKTTRNYKGQSHYTKSFQHVLYMHVEHIKRFEYLVAEFIEGQKQVVNHYKDCVEVEDTEALRAQIDDKIRRTMDFIRRNGLMEAYTDKFSGGGKT